MKTHKSLKELLEDYTQKYFDKHFDGFPRVQSKWIDVYVSTNSLALGKPEPLAKNKKCDDDFFCEWSEAHDMDNQKCGTQCIYCKSH